MADDRGFNPTEEQKKRFHERLARGKRRMKFLAEAKKVGKTRDQVTSQCLYQKAEFPDDPSEPHPPCPFSPTRPCPPEFVDTHGPPLSHDPDDLMYVGEPFIVEPGQPMPQMPLEVLRRDHLPKHGIRTCYQNQPEELNEGRGTFVVGQPGPSGQQGRRGTFVMSNQQQGRRGTFVTSNQCPPSVQAGRGTYGIAQRPEVFREAPEDLQEINEYEDLTPAGMWQEIEQPDPVPHIRWPTDTTVYARYEEPLPLAPWGRDEAVQEFDPYYRDPQAPPSPTRGEPSFLTPEPQRQVQERTSPCDDRAPSFYPRPTLPPAPPPDDMSPPYYPCPGQSSAPPPSPEDRVPYFPPQFQGGQAEAYDDMSPSYYPCPGQPSAPPPSPEDRVPYFPTQFQAGQAEAYYPEERVPYFPSQEPQEEENWAYDDTSPPFYPCGPALPPAPPSSPDDRVCAPYYPPQEPQSGPNRAFDDISPSFYPRPMLPPDPQPSAEGRACLPCSPSQQLLRGDNRASMLRRQASERSRAQCPEAQAGPVYRPQHQQRRTPQMFPSTPVSSRQTSSQRQRCPRAPRGFSPRSQTAMGDGRERRQCPQGQRGMSPQAQERMTEEIRRTMAQARERMGCFGADVMDDIGRELHRK